MWLLLLPCGGSRQHWWHPVLSREELSRLFQLVSQHVTAACRVRGSTVREVVYCPHRLMSCQSSAGSRLCAAACHPEGDAVMVQRQALKHSLGCR